MIDKDLLDILACPKCKNSVRYEDNKIICDNCRKYYPVKDDIPVMLIEEAKNL